MYKIKELRQQKADLVNENKTLLEAATNESRELSEDEAKKWDANEAELKKVEASIVRVDRQIEAENSLSRGVDRAKRLHVEEVTAGSVGEFSNFGEFLIAVATSAKTNGRKTDPRLFAATGANEAIPSEGGFLVEQPYAAGLLARTYEVGQILQRVNRTPLSGNANGLKIRTISESSRATGYRFGGLHVYRKPEGVAKVGSKPAFGQIELNLKKLTALFYATDELLEDAAALTSIVNRVFPEEMSFTIEDEIIRGDGASQMLGILNAACKVTVAKETGQVGKTVVYENIVNMWSRMWARSRLNAVWLVNQDVEPQLFGMGLVIGTGGTPVYMPPGGLSASPYSTLFGRPVIAVEYCDTLGTEGDIILADFSQYETIDKGGLQTASSIHVKFVEDETVFRFVYRNDGQPSWQSALTPYKGGATKTVSPFVTLAVRA